MQDGNWTRREINTAGLLTALSAKIPIRIAGNVPSIASNAGPSAIANAVAKINPKAILTSMIQSSGACAKIVTDKGLAESKLVQGLNQRLSSEENANICKQFLDSAFRQLCSLAMNFDGEKQLFSKPVINALWQGTPGQDDAESKTLVQDDYTITMQYERRYDNIDFYCQPHKQSGKSVDIRKWENVLGANEQLGHLLTCKYGRKKLYELIKERPDSLLNEPLLELLNARDGKRASPLLKKITELTKEKGHGDVRTVGHVRSQLFSRYQHYFEQFDKAQGEKEERLDPEVAQERWKAATGLTWIPLEHKGKITHYAAQTKPTSTTRHLLWGDVPNYHTALAITVSVEQRGLEEGESAKYRARLDENTDTGLLRVAIPKQVFLNPAYPAYVQENLGSREFSDNWKRHNYWQAANRHTAERSR